MLMLDIGEEFFLDDIQERVIIKNKMRNNNGGIVYYVDDKLIETDNTLKSKNECDKIIKDFEQFKNKFKNYKETYKYKHKFFNFY